MGDAIPIPRGLVYRATVPVIERRSRIRPCCLALGSGQKES